MKKMRKQLIKLLNIHGVSGDETAVRNYLKPILTDMMDRVVTDSYGNLLAEKIIGSGDGATILLSAHMDTVRGVQADRKILESNGVFTSDKGALGADDRAGIAIIMEVLRNVEKLSFEGTIKVAFSREEEIGCVGVKKIDPRWYEDVDLAIVVDRRGNRDIVTGCYSAFCSDAVGKFFEEASAMQDMNWKACEGGISDATVFSAEGIHSVNLSAGYMNEHTEREFVVFEDMKDTVRLMLQALAIVNNFYGTFGEVPEENEWVKSYSTTRYSKYASGYNTDVWEDMVYAEEFDQHGDVFCYEVGRDVVIQQGDNEILLSRASLRSLMTQLKDSLDI